MSDDEKVRVRAVISVIRALGFVGNAHYCSSCMNHFHEDRGQHKPGCSILADLRADEEWWLS